MSETLSSNEKYVLLVLDNTNEEMTLRDLKDNIEDLSFTEIDKAIVCLYLKGLVEEVAQVNKPIRYRKALN